jgi:hypothetical protein
VDYVVTEVSGVLSLPVLLDIRRVGQQRGLHGLLLLRRACVIHGRLRGHRVRVRCVDLLQVDATEHIGDFGLRDVLDGLCVCGVGSSMSDRGC